jgi:hypothetical protein
MLLCFFQIARKWISSWAFVVTVITCKVMKHWWCQEQMIQCVDIVSKKVTLVTIYDINTYIHMCTGHLWLCISQALIHTYVYRSPLALYIKSLEIIYNRKAVLGPVIFDTFHAFYLLHQNLCELCQKIQKMQNVNLGYSLLSWSTVQVSPIICD